MIDQVQNPRPSGYMKDANMQQASDEISAILRKHDLMGVVLLAGRERSGWNIELSPSWSCVRPGEPVEGGGVTVRIRAKEKDYANRKELERVLSMTLGGIMGIVSHTRFINQSLSNMLQAVSHQVEVVNVQHDPSIANVRIRRDDEEKPQPPAES